MAVVAERQLNPRSDPASPWWHIDPTPLLASIGLGLIGLVAIYSATRGRDEANFDTTFLQRQLLFLVVGVVVVAVTAVFDYRLLLRIAGPAYIGMLATLVLVLLIGRTVNGATSWFAIGSYRLQPSEFAKISLIVILAATLSRTTAGPLPLAELIRAIGIAVPSIILVVLQPDVGTVMVFFAITAAMLLVGRAEAGHMFFLIAVAGVSIGLLFNSPLLADYQTQRLEAFLQPEVLPGEAATSAQYNLKQAQIAIGNGGMTGTGFGEGTQTKSGLVPEQQTDFIFTVIGEEFGFVGGTVMLALYAFLLWRLYRIARLAGDSFGGYLVAGVLAMFGFQMFQSVGMTMGIMPITGIPLPFVSYGGSSALTSFVGLGIAISVHMRRFGAGIDAEIATKTA